MINATMKKMLAADKANNPGNPDPNQLECRQQAHRVLANQLGLTVQKVRDYLSYQKRKQN